MFQKPRFICLISLLVVCVSAHEVRADTKVDIERFFSPSGWMGDGEYLKEYRSKYIEFSGADRHQPHSPPSSIKITYTFGPKRWAGIYWLNKPDNWGDERGSDYSGEGISRVTFWAKGETGNEVVEFKSGGIENRYKNYRDSFGATTGRISLSDKWMKYEINLSNLDLSSVIGGFCWVASADFNPGKMVIFYLDDIVFE